jgi:ankyrin repeat protein
LAGGAVRTWEHPLLLKLVLTGGLDGHAGGEKMTLHEAAARGDVVEVRRLVAHGVKVDSRDTDGVTALHWAARLGKTEAIKVLVELGADKDAKDKTGGTPLHFVSLNGHAEATRCVSREMLRRDAG